MRQRTLKMALLAAMLGLVAVVAESPARAAGWAITIDTPLSYTFNSGDATTSTANSPPATWNGRSTTQVSGSKVLLITPIHIGFGYEDYSVKNNITFPQGSGTGTGQITTSIRMYDVALDLPMKYLNLTLGYGQGTADTDFAVISAGSGGAPNPIRNATATQVFLVVGIPLGQTFDIHVGYHWLTVQQQDIVTPGSGGGPSPQTQQDGQMLSAGLRFNF